LYPGPSRNLRSSVGRIKRLHRSTPLSHSPTRREYVERTPQSLLLQYEITLPPLKFRVVNLRNNASTLSTSLNVTAIESAPSQRRGLSRRHAWRRV
jgi:hypothetical protein